MRQRPRRAEQHRRAKRPRRMLGCGITTPETLRTGLRTRRNERDRYRHRASDFARITGSHWRKPMAFVCKDEQINHEGHESCTKEVSTHMRRIFIIALLTLALGPQNWSVAAFATAYYVSSSTGSDTNGGTSAASPWQTIAHVNAQTFQPGDSVLFKRGDVWNESLAPASSGAS